LVSAGIGIMIRVKIEGVIIIDIDMEIWVCFSGK
jgi:hypothetical protein